MVSNAFIGRTAQPAEDELAAALGSAKPVWDRLLAELAQEYGLTAHEWNSYSPKAGWSLRVKRGDRNILYLSPGNGCFMVSFALGDKAVQAAKQGSLPKRVIEIISSAKRYAEGTAVRLDVTGVRDVAAVKKLAAVKLQH